MSGLTLWCILSGFVVGASLRMRYNWGITLVGIFALALFNTFIAYWVGLPTVVPPIETLD